jgi:hypothetical protein
MVSTPCPGLTEFFRVANAGCSVSDFLKRYNELIENLPRDQDKQLRAALGPYKKLQDEIGPATVFACHILRADDIIVFDGSYAADDCHVMRGEKTVFRIQITTSRSREHYELMKELNQSGSAPGFLGLRNDATSSQFRDKLRRARISYSRRELIAAFCAAVEEALERKRNVAGGHTLLIGAPKYSIRESDLVEVLPRLTISATDAPFPLVFLATRFFCGGSQCFQLRGSADAANYAALLFGSFLISSPLSCSANRSS